MVENEVMANTVVEAPPTQMQFRLISPDEGGFLKHIVWNKDELEAAVRAKVAEYEGIVYTEETVKAAKNDRAELNKLFKAIEDRRKKVKNTLNQPYAQFEAEVKEVTSLITNQSKKIDEQIEAFERRQKEEKKEKLREVYESNIGELTLLLPFESFFDLRYLNQTVKLPAAIADMKSKIERAWSDIQIIDRTCTKFRVNARDVYARTMDLSKALDEEKRLRDMEERMRAEQERKEREAAHRKAEEERKAAEAARKAEWEARRAEEERKADEERRAEQERQMEAAQKAAEEAEWREAERPESAMNHPVDGIEKAGDNDLPFTDGKPMVTAAATAATEPAAETEKKVRARFYAIGTMAQLRALTQYMKDNGIRYGKAE